MFTNNQTETLENPVESRVENKRKLVLINDDVNTFDHVIDCLVHYCEHNNIQAEQCAFLTHYKGSCEIKTGSFEDLYPLKSALQNEKLTVCID